MTWLRIDDGREIHPKVASLSDSAHRLWSMAAGWCSRYRTNGFVPETMLAAAASNRYSKRILVRLAKELVEAKGGGLYKVGLWEPVEGGWQFHDWSDYNPTQRREDESEDASESLASGTESSRTSSAPLSPTEKARLAGKASAEARKQRNGTAQPSAGNCKSSPCSSPENMSERPELSSNLVRTSSELVRESSSNSDTELNPELAEPEPEPPVPLSSDLLLVAAAKDLTGFPRELNPPQLQRQQVEHQQSGTRPAIAPPPPAPRPPTKVSDEHSGPREQIPPSAVNVARLPSRADRARSNLESLPINELALEYQRNPTWVAESSPQTRPELANIAKAWDDAVGLTHQRLGHATRDEATRKLLGLYADGATYEQLLTVCKQAGRDEWICGRASSNYGSNYSPNSPNSQSDVRKRRIDVLTPKVFRRLLDAAEANRPTRVTPAVKAMLEAEAAREAALNAGVTQ